MARVTKFALDAAQREASFWRDASARNSQRATNAELRASDLTLEIERLTKNLKTTAEAGQRMLIEHAKHIEVCADKAANMITQARDQAIANTMAEAFKYLADRVTDKQEG